MKPVENDLALDTLQQVMLELLATKLPPAEILARLRSDARLAAYRPYLDTFEPRMIEVAQHLVARWGRRGSVGR